MLFFLRVFHIDYFDFFLAQRFFAQKKELGIKPSSKIPPKEQCEETLICTLPSMSVRSFSLKKADLTSVYPNLFVNKPSKTSPFGVLFTLSHISL